MSDPAVEAAKRAWRTASHWRHDLPSSGRLTSVITEAAREALKPLRELHRPIKRTESLSICAACYAPSGRDKLWPCDTARLIYAESELE